MTDKATARTAARPPSDRTRVRRAPKRGHYDRATIEAVLDAGFVCHVGYVIDGSPYVTPTLYWRDGDRVYWHGSSASRMLRQVEGAAVCLTVSHIDGMVLARSGFHHSANFRAVMLFGQAEKVTDQAVKSDHLDRFVDGLFPGRVAEIREATAQELKGTTLLSMPIEEASAKIRTGGPVDDEPDYASPVWAGVIPLRTVAGEPIPDERMESATAVPDHVREFMSRISRANA